MTCTVSGAIVSGYHKLVSSPSSCWCHVGLSQDTSRWHTHLSDKLDSSTKFPGRVVVHIMGWPPSSLWPLPEFFQLAVTCVTFLSRTSCEVTASGYYPTWLGWVILSNGSLTEPWTVATIMLSGGISKIPHLTDPAFIR